MNTLLLSKQLDINVAATILQEGGLVAVPTETVYGLAANALNTDAVANIFKAKGRPSDNPLIVHISSLSMLDSLVLHIPPVAQSLMNAFWPGPLTLIFKANPIIPKIVTGGLDTVGIRFPSHPVMQNLIDTCKLPLAAPSANTSGKPSPTNAKRVLEDMNGKVDAVLDGGECDFGVESTVLDITGDIPTLLRPGGITIEMLEKVVGKVLVDPALYKKPDASIVPKAPGMKYTHYSPNAEVIIVEGPITNVIEKINDLTKIDKLNGKKVGVLATDDTKTSFHADLVISVGTDNHLQTIASHLFEALRRFDDKKIDTVYSLSFPKHDIGIAVMNRLEKAAGHHILKIN